MSGQPWFTSTTSGGWGPESANRSSVFSSLKSRFTRFTVTFGYRCSNSAFSRSQILLTCPDSWSQTVSVMGPVSGTPVVAGAGGADARSTVPPGVQAATTAKRTRLAATADVRTRPLTTRTLGANIIPVKAMARYRFLSVRMRSIIGACRWRPGACSTASSPGTTASGRRSSAS